MSAAGRALLAARLAGVTVTRNGDRIDLAADRKPPAELLENLRQNKPAILELLATERCRACRGLGTADRPLIECCYAGHWLLLHRDCLKNFPDTDAATSERYAPRRVCDYCGQPGGHLENIGYLGGPIGGVPVHLRCAAAWFDRLNAIPLRVFM
jgi:hypothetical protein